MTPCPHGEPIATCPRPFCGCIPSDSWQPEQPPLPLEDE